MKDHLGSILLGLTVLVTSAAGAQTVYIPAGAHALGYNGTVWRTDIELKSCDNEDARVRIEALLRDTENSTPQYVDVDVDAGTTLRIDDALKTLFHTVGVAAFRINTVTGCVLVTSRTYNDSASGTYGQYVPAIPEEQAFDYHKQAQLIQLSQSKDNGTGYRTAIGLINLTGSNLRVELLLYSSSGKFFGPYSQTLLPHEYVQLDRIFTKVTFLDVPDGYAIVRTSTVNGKFLAYASVVDNRSGDAIFIPAQGVQTGEESSPQ